MIRILVLFSILVGLGAEAAVSTKVKVAGKIVNLTEKTIELQGASGSTFMVSRPKGTSGERLRPGQLVKVMVELSDLYKMNRK